MSTQKKSRKKLTASKGQTPKKKADKSSPESRLTLEEWERQAEEAGRASGITHVIL